MPNQGTRLPRSVCPTDEDGRGRCAYPGEDILQGLGVGVAPDLSSACLRVHIGQKTRTRRQMWGTKNLSVSPMPGMIE